MICELPPDRRCAALPLFDSEPSDYSDIIAPAILNGNAPGRIWADSLDAPKAAYLWDGFHCHFLAGAPESPEFLRDLALRIRDEIAPEALSNGRAFLKLLCRPVSWERRLPELFGGIAFTKRDRELFQFKPSDATDDAFDDSGIEEIDASTLARPALQGRDALEDEIRECWSSPDRFFESGFGYGLIRDGEIVSRITGEYADGDRIGIGIATERDCERQGFATRLAQAFVRRCGSEGLTAYWDCWRDNLASMRVAEKTGFSPVSVYPAWIGEFR